MRKLILCLSLLFLMRLAPAQSMIQVKGVVYDGDSNEVLDSVTIIVKHTSRIAQNKADGSFSVFVKPTDTLIFGLWGYKIKYLCFKDSVQNKDYVNIKVKLSHLQENIREVVINTVRPQRDVRRDMENLAYKYAYSSPNAFQSPISAIYAKNSHKAQAKQLLHDYEFELAKNKLIKQLLDIYNKQGIIDLPSDQYKAFIEHINLDWDFLVIATDYQLAVFVKKKALQWQREH